MRELVLITGMFFLFSVVFITNAILIYKGANGWGWFLIVSFIFLNAFKVNIPENLSSCDCKNSVEKQMPKE